MYWPPATAASYPGCHPERARDGRDLLFDFHMTEFTSPVYYFCMTTDERLDRLTGIVENLAKSAKANDSAMTRLAGAVTKHDSVIKTLAGAVTAHDSGIEAHDRQIGALIELADRNQKAINDLDRRWQAYLNTLRKQ